MISAADALGEGGAKTKFKDNIAALRMLSVLRDEERSATVQEQAVLVRYVGWGGMPQAFDPSNAEWAREYEELRTLLPGDEYDAARRSTQDAHYTAQPVVEAMYAGVSRLGVKGGKFLESAVGTGNFIGLMPQEMRADSKFTGIELDPVTAAIAKHLYPTATIVNKGFQEVSIPQGYFDIAIGNPPFGNQKLYDREHKELGDFSIHNYFIAKSLDKVRPGGVVAVVVSSYFLDAHLPTAREHIAQTANLIGAIRLPNTAFKKNALTDVTTDIVFLQKRTQEQEADLSWVEVGSVRDDETGEDISLNRYYLDHPEMMLGRMGTHTTGFGRRAPTLFAHPGQDLSAELSRAINALPEGIYQEATNSRLQAVANQTDGEPIEIPADTKVGAYFLTQTGAIARRLPDVLADQAHELVELKNERAGQRIKGMIEVRLALRALMAAERTDADDAQLHALRRDLNRVYDRFVKQHGFISSLVNKQAMGDDPEYPLLHALERDYDKGISKDSAAKNGVEPREPTAQKAAIFTKRVMAPRRDITSVSNAKDALVVSMNERGRVDLDLMVRLLGKPEDDLVNELRGLIFHNPTSKAWETADQYLTGNVKAKLGEARAAAATDPKYGANVDALVSVQPKDIEPVDIAIQLGSTWVPEQYVSDFVTHVLGGVTRQITYQEAIGKWIVKISPADRTTNHMQWGTAEAGANSLIERILENRPIEVKEQIGRDEKGPIYRTNAEKTAAATQKADELRQAFLDWVWEDKERRDALATLYNDRFNTDVAPRFNGSHLTLPGASIDITLRPHQKDAIWRGVQEGTALFDHVVGAGKTMVCIGVAMESRRMGLAKKPMLNVPNHLLLQWKDAFYQLYPDANVLVAEKSDFTKENREKLFARIATGDWDAVIVGHSSFKKIGMPEATLSEILTEQIDDLTEAITEMRRKNGDRITIKTMEKARERMTAKLEKMADRGSKDQAVTFEDLGVDMLITDEADLYKNLFINTTMQQVAGLGNLTGSDMAFDLFIKCRYLQQKYDGRGVFKATGTPISNTIAEMYTLQRYMQYDELKRRGIVHFDAWASTFGQVVSGWELDATGVNYRLNSRFSKFQNVPELVAMYRSFADVILREDLEEQARAQGKRFPVPKIAGGKPKNIIVDRSPLQAEFMGIQQPRLDVDGQPVLRADGSTVTDWNEGSIIHRMENMPKDPRVDNPLKVTNDARKAGLDFRLINPAAPDFEGSKVNAAVDEMMRIYKKWDAEMGTQLVFCDLSTPKSGRGASQVRQVAVSNDEEQDDQEQSSESVSMDELLASSSKFSVYDDIRAKLIARGVPSSEVRFVHEANTDLQKAKLFDKMNRGEVRFLLGSTAKMGAGTNVQKKLVAKHDLDAPWRPRDLEQRDGRIIRQGNEFYDRDPDGFEVELIRYATKQTYDSRMWQTIEVKASGIEQFRKGGGQRVIEDIASEAANAAEMKAAATGNPLIFMQVQLSADLRKVEAVYANHKRNMHAVESRLQWLDRAEVRAEHRIKGLQEEIRVRDANTTEEFAFVAGGRTLRKDDKDALLAHFVATMEAAVKAGKTFAYEKEAPVKVGRYRGFELEAVAMQGSLQFVLHGPSTPRHPPKLAYNKDESFSIDGFFRRIDNVLETFEASIADTEEDLVREQAERTKARTEAGKPFADERKLLALRKDVADVMTELKKTQADPKYVSTWEPSSSKLNALDAPLSPASAGTGHDIQETVARADETVRRFMAGAESPAAAEEIFDRAFDALMEMGDGKEVHALVIERIGDDPVLAEAVSSYPGKRFASPQMLEAAEAVTQHRHAAAEHAQKMGFDVAVVNRDDGQYVGTFVGATDRYFVHDVGQRRAVLHAKDDLLVKTLKVGDSVRVTYRFGAAMASLRDRSQDGQSHQH
ncbi:hypothetical protein R77560_04607 [Ralstonia thomasii]|uniref:Helicase C-terminal domain-containing protein n=1 Tax=Ralstonia thomasii TaxID=3058596 RepID=A0AAD2BSK2_9RALS|nr:DEAD/DEAH box helicase family protein [Ralstonia sp. LMG 18095]CAJ0807661.1 hypothetical protein R77560_04607 [Ralstonia sp. LMG 18095]